jgi:hypothetical protein
MSFVGVVILGCGRVLGHACILKLKVHHASTSALFSSKFCKVLTDGFKTKLRQTKTFDRLESNN